MPCPTKTYSCLICSELLLTLQTLELLQQCPVQDWRLQEGQGAAVTSYALHCVSLQSRRLCTRLHGVSGSRNVGRSQKSRSNGRLL